MTQTVKLKVKNGKVDAHEGPIERMAGTSMPGPARR